MRNKLSPSRALDLNITLNYWASVIVSLLYFLIILYDYVFPSKHTTLYLAICLIGYIAFTVISRAIILLKTDTEIE